MFDPGLLKGQAAIVTGGGTGIGKGIARRLGELGARVMIASRSADHVEPAAAELDAAGLDVVPFLVDVRDPAGVDAMVAAAIARFGGVDILVNNAAGNFICRSEDLSPNGWNAVINIVLNGTFYCSRAVGRHMIARGRGGNIVSIVATYARTGSPGTIHSASAKAGVIAMMQTLAVEWAPHRIRANAVAPGPIAGTGGADRLWSAPGAEARVINSVPARRLGSAEEIANAVAFLVAPDSSFITGDVLTVDGGQWLNRLTFGFL